MKTQILAAAPLAAFFMLGGCSPEPVYVGPPNSSNAAEGKTTADLPPSIKEAKTYRCRDNSLVHVTFLTDNVTAQVRDKEEQPPLATLKASAPGEPFEGQGYSVSGSGSSINYKSPDGPSQSCRS